MSNLYAKMKKAELIELLEKQEKEMEALVGDTFTLNKAVMERSLDQGFDKTKDIVILNRYILQIQSHNRKKIILRLKGRAAEGTPNGVFRMTGVKK